PSQPTSFHHQPEAQHPKSSAIHKLGQPITPSKGQKRKSPGIRRRSMKPTHRVRLQPPFTATPMPRGGYYAGCAALRCSTIRMKSRAVGSEASTAIGHKQTSAHVRAMSALPRKRTSGLSGDVSALGQTPTWEDCGLLGRSLADSVIQKFY